MSHSANMVPLGKLGKVISGSTPNTNIKAYWNGDIPWITPADLTNHEGIYFKGKLRKITKAGYKNCSATMLPPGSIIFSSRAPIGHCAVNTYALCTNQGFKSIVPNENLDSIYGFFALKFFTPQIIARGRGATFLEVSKEIIEDSPIPLPPLPKQKHVAAMLEKADRLRCLRRYARELSDTYLKSVFLEMFGNPVLNLKGWDQEKLGKLIKLKSGNFLNAATMDNRGRYPVYGGNGLCGVHSSYMFKEQKIVIGRVGVYCGAVHYTKPYSWVTDNALYVHRKDPCLLDLYTVYLLRYINLNQYSGQFAQPLISEGRLESILLPIPKAILQEKFVQIVQKFERLQSQQREAERQAEHLFQTLMHRAFRGELTGE